MNINKKMDEHFKDLRIKDRIKELGITVIIIVLVFVAGLILKGV